MASSRRRYAAQLKPQTLGRGSVVDNLASWMWVAAFIGYCAFFRVTLHRLRSAVADAPEDEAKRHTRRWAIRAGLLLPATFLPVYVKEVVAAVRDLGSAAVTAPAVAVAIVMLGAGAWTAAWFYWLERRAQKAAVQPVG